MSQRVLRTNWFFFQQFADLSGVGRPHHAFLRNQRSYQFGRRDIEYRIARRDILRRPAQFAVTPDLVRAAFLDRDIWAARDAGVDR
jgi:hypothetical protein